MPISKDLDNYLQTAPFDKSVCHIVGPRIADNPALFFILYSASGPREFDPEEEKISSGLIQQIVREAEVKDVFTEGIVVDTSQFSSATSEVNELLAEGQINGAHHAQIVSSIPLTVVSIDEMEGYKHSSDVLSKWKSRKDGTLKALFILRSALKRITPSANKTVQTLLILKDAYNSGRVTLNDYVRGLAQQAKSVGLSLKKTPAFLNFYELVLSEKEIDSEKTKKEIEIFTDKLIQALENKDLWLRQTVEALCPMQTGETPNEEEIEAQARFLSNYLVNSSKIRKLRESLFFRIAMYGAYVEGYNQLENPSVPQVRRRKAFVSGVLQGPTRILMLLIKKLMAASAHRDQAVPEAYDFILDAAIFAGFDEADLPNLIRHVQFDNRSRSMITPKLMEDIENVEKILLERAIVSGHDKGVVGLHMAYMALGKRVQLQMNRGEMFRAYLQEQPKENYALKIERAPIIQKMMKQELHVALKVLNDTESIAREFYKGLEKRSQAMITNLQTELSKNNIDRAIVYVGEDHCKSLITHLEPNTSYVVLIPGTERRENVDFSHILVRQKKASGAESDIVFYRDLEEDSKSIPRKLCDNPLCRFSAPVISDRVVCLTSPGSQAVFYCDICDKYYCGIELKPVFMSDEDFEALLSFNPSELFEVVEGKPPFSLQCRHCGNFVGKGERTAVWNISE